MKIGSKIVVFDPNLKSDIANINGNIEIAVGTSLGIWSFVTYCPVFIFNQKEQNINE